MTASFVSWQRESLQFAKSYPSMPLARRVAFVEPKYFQIVSALNPHMLDESGQLNQIDSVRAYQQWQALTEVYRSLGLQIDILEAEPDCPDMVFCANQSLPYLDEAGQSSILMSHMASDCRQREVQSIETQLDSLGIKTTHLGIPRSQETIFEGTGDALWVPGRKLLLGAYGFRSSADIYNLVSEQLQVSVAIFELKNPRFYHLDTCLSILDENTAIASPEGFTSEGWEQLQRIFVNLIPIDLDEADSPGFAGNAHCPDGKHVVIQEGNIKIETALKAAGFLPVPVNTREFIKSGGSVFCMKLMLF
ncbi:MAG: dimethylarginine dimethylaminohydrolase family protein [Oligoflexus sp.]